LPGCGCWNAHTYFAGLRGHGWGLWLILAVAAIPLLASGLLTLARDLFLPIRIGLIVLAAIAAPLLFFAIELAAYDAIERAGANGAIVALSVSAVGFLLFWGLFDINFTAPHRHYKKKLGEAYLVQLNTASAEAPLRENVSLKLSKCTGEQAPYHLVNCALNVPASKDSRMQGRLTDFFLFSREFCGSPLTDYSATGAWEQVDPTLDLGTAMAISGAAAGPNGYRDDPEPQVLARTVQHSPWLLDTQSRDQAMLAGWPARVVLPPARDVRRGQGEAPLH
jgi:hypothetical protein